MELTTRSGAVDGVFGVLTRGRVHCARPGEERVRARRVFGQFSCPGAGTEDPRRTAPPSEIGKKNWPLVCRLADRRLVVTGRDSATGQETVELAHEALIERWERLRGWLAADRAFLRVARGAASCAPSVGGQQPLTRVRCLEAPY